MTRSFLRTIGLLLLPLALAACQSDEQKAAEHLSRGDAYFEEEEYGEAAIEYKNVLQINPNDGEVHYKLAQTYLKSEKVRDAFWELRESVRLEPENIDARVQLSQLLFYAKELDEALEMIDGAIASEPDRVEAHVVRAQVLLAQGQKDESLAAFAKAVEVGPEEEGALLLYASALEQNGEVDAAEEWFVKLTEVAPNFRSYAAFAMHLARRRDESRNDEIIAAFEKGIEVAEPDELPGAHSALAGFYYEQDRIEEAAATLEKAIDESKDNLDLIYSLARLHSSQGDEAKADALVEQATKASPDEARPYLILSAHRDRKGDLPGALEAARKAVEVEPEHEDARLRVAEVMIEIGVKQEDDTQIAEGRELVEQLLVQKPGHPGALLVKSKVDLYEKDIDAAITGLRTAIDARPEWAQAHFVLGTALAMKGDETSARSALARALEIDASLLQARRVLAQVHARLRENEYAVEEGRRYLRGRPDDTQLRILVAQSLIRLGKSQEAQNELAQIPEENRNAEVWYAHGRIDMGKRNYGEARKNLLLALGEMSDNYDILNSLYIIDRVEGRVEESVARIEAAVAANPESARLLVLRGNIALADRRGEDAEASFKKAIEIAPEDLKAYEHLARYFATTGRLREAIGTYESAVSVRPNTAQVHHLLGVLYELAGEREKAIENYEVAIRNAPNLGEAKNNLAYLYADSGINLDRALDLAQEAKALLPDNANAADTLGWVLLKRGVPTAAISYLKEAEVGTEPGSATLGIVRYHLALAYEATGDAPAAITTLERALRELETQLAEASERGSSPVEPEWAADARSMLDRLRQG